jgi:hypothetical protein
LCELAADNGCFDMVKLLHESGCLIDERIIHPISHRGDVNMIQWMRSVGITLSEEFSLAVTHSGHLEALRWLKKEGFPLNLSHCLSVACTQGHIDIIEWLRDQGCKFRSADRIGYWEAYLFNCGLQKFSETVKGKKIQNYYHIWMSLARQGDLKTLKWAKSEGFLTFDDDDDDCGCGLVNAAIHGGNMPVVCWFIDNENGFCGHSASFAAREGHLMLLKVLHGNFCNMVRTEYI